MIEARITQRVAAIAARIAIRSKPTAHVKNRRSSPRQKVYRHGRITLPGGDKAKCRIVDLSENGARIEIVGASDLPDMVMLKITATGKARRARVIWRTETAAGLSFTIEAGRIFGSRPTRKTPPLKRRSESPANELHDA